MDLQQKISEYNAVLTSIRSEISRTYEEALIYKLVVDTLSQIPYFSSIGIYFFNPVTEEFYLGYYTGKHSIANIIKSDQLKFTNFEIINDTDTEERFSICSDIASECKLLLTKNETALGLIVVGSDDPHSFDEIDKKYLPEIAETVADKVYHR